VKPIQRSVAQQVRYRFDNTISRGTLPVIGYLALLTFVLVFGAALVLTITGTALEEGEDPGILEAFWQSLLRILDPGTFSGDNGWFLRAVMLIVTLFGISIAAVLIGLIASGIEQRIEQLRRGRSAVLETGHTLILGFSPRIHTVISELCIANENQKKPRIVVLANKDKQEIEHEIGARLVDPGRTKVVCRSGDPASIQALGMASATEARSIIVLGGDEPETDADVVKAVIAARHVVGDRDIPIVAELNDAETARALQEAGGDRVKTVRAADVIARITAQACRQSGLSAVCQDILDFEGDEIYFQPCPELVGKTFGDALLSYEQSSVIGLQSPGCKVAVNPQMDTVIRDGDSVIAISADDDTVVFTGVREVPDGSPPVDGQTSHPEQLLLVGWNALGEVVLRELDQFVPPGSSADVLVDPDLVDPSTLPQLSLTRLSDVRYEADRGDLDELTQHVGGRTFDHVVILGYRTGLAGSEADARTLLTLLLLRRVLAQNGDGGQSRIVTELLDSSDVELARATGADDFVVSDELSSCMIAQLSENPQLDPVFEDLFDAEGSAIGLKPAERYVAIGEDMRYERVVAVARSRGEVAIGYRRFLGDGATPEVVMNPLKSQRVVFNTGDRVVVIGPPE
jgi:voltage-gated potassium channel Kch